MNEDVSAIEKVKKPRWLVVVLTLLPAWLIISAVIGLWMFFKQEKEKNSQPTLIGGFQVSPQSIADDFLKLCDVIGPRHQRAAPEGLLRTAAMIEGGMGRSNAGFDVRKYEGIPNVEKAQPFLHIRLAGQDDPMQRRVWVLVPYDAPTNAAAPRGAAAASALTVAMAAATTMSQQRFDNPPNFLFVPSMHSDEADVNATFQRVKTIIGQPSAVAKIMVLGNLLHLGKIEEVPAAEYLSFAASVEQGGYPITLLMTENAEGISSKLEDQMNPPGKLFAAHAAALRTRLFDLCVKKQ